ncbi:MAG TPA: hypothetical protein VMF89_04895, partial [Polyangiales bacterium]|nr:hypothetical protein [Polyangiales bacterium]
EDVIAVLGDLVASGLLYATGRGKQAAYGATSRSDQEALMREQKRETLLHVVWLELAAPQGMTRRELAQRFPEHDALIDQTLRTLLADGRARVDTAEGVERYRSANVLIPVGSEAGFATAVLDHFRAVCGALSNKLARIGAASSDDALIGGTTLSFELSQGHPFEQEVKGLLGRVRADIFALWHQVSAHNQQEPPDEDALERIVFYVGQNFIPNAAASAPRAQEGS